MAVPAIIKTGIPIREGEGKEIVGGKNAECSKAIQACLELDLNIFGEEGTEGRRPIPRGYLARKRGVGRGETRCLPGRKTCYDKEWMGSSDET